MLWNPYSLCYHHSRLRLPESISFRPTLPIDLRLAISFAESIDYFDPFRRLELGLLVVPAVVPRLAIAIIQPK